MATPKPVTVPEEEVGDAVQSFIDNDGVEHLTVEKLDNGTFKITPTAT